jgi:hypothetical protein
MQRALTGAPTCTAHPMMLKSRHPVQASRHIDQFRAEALPAEHLAGAQRDAGTTVRLRYRCHGAHGVPRGWRCDVRALCCVLRGFARSCEIPWSRVQRRLVKAIIRICAKPSLPARLLIAASL